MDLRTSVRRAGQPTDAELVGRDGALEAIRTALAAGAPTLLVGEAGVGKSTLLASVVVGRRVFLGGGLDLLSSVPYLALSRAVGAVGVGDVGGVAERVLARVASDILIVDDLQWTDEASLAVLELIGDRLLLLGAIRTGSRRADEVAERLASVGWRQLGVTPLEPEAAARLATRVAPDLSASAAQVIATRAGGNPLLIGELARSGETGSLRRALAHRLRDLEPHARTLAGTLAVAREPVRWPEDDPAAVLVRGGFARRTGEVLEIRHALIAEAIESDMTADERVGAHRRLARLVSDPGVAARHLLAAGDRRAARRAALAAVEAGGLTPGDQARLAALAAETAEGPAAVAERIAAAEGLLVTMLSSEAERLVAPLAPDDRRLAARRAAILARAAWARGDGDAAAAAVAAGLRALETEVDDGGADPTGSEATAAADPEAGPEAAGLLVEAAWLEAVVRRRGATAIPIAERALAAVEGAALPTARARRILAIALYLAGGSRERWWPLIVDGLARARSSGDAAEEAALAKLAVVVSESAGDPDEGRRIGETGTIRARNAGLILAEQSIRASLITLANSQGDFRRVVLEAQALLAEPLEPRTREEAVDYLALALVDLGRLDEARRIIDDGLRTSADDVAGRLDLLWAQAELELASGDAPAAEAIAEHCLARFDATDHHDRLFLWIVGAWARLERGLAPVRRLDPRGRLDLLYAGVPHEAAGIAALAGDRPGEAATHFSKAAAGYARHHRRSEMRARWAEGEALRRAGRLDEARAALAGVETRADALGMVPLAARIRRSLRLAGVRRAAPRGARGTLTAREREILALVAEGRTNAQIATRLGIGRPTVARTLANASTKLGAVSRAQAAMEALAVE